MSITNRSCPKCGSIQILNDECLGCGLLLSKFQSISQTKDGASGISYVAPAQPGRINIVLATPKTDNRSKIILAIILVCLSSAGYYAYNLLLRQASAYGGYYKNGEKLFALNFPEKGWNHYYSPDLKQPEFKDASDAFYRGDDADDPEIVMAVWLEPLDAAVPDRLDEQTATTTLGKLEQEITRRMERAKLQPLITSSKSMLIGGNHGFAVHADLMKGSTRMKTVIYCAFNMNNGYTVQFIGKEEDVLEHQAEIESMMETFNFKMSIF
jgi:hypothetical protein